jgi:hypothetical protein
VPVLLCLALISPASAAAHETGGPALALQALLTRIEAGEVKEAFVYRDESETDVELENGARFTVSYPPSVERDVLARLRRGDVDFDEYANRSEHDTGGSTLVIALVLGGLTIAALLLHRMLARRRVAPAS